MRQWFLNLKFATFRWVLLALLTVFPATVAAQTSQVSCTDATNTVCTAKKFQPFALTADPALTTDTVATVKWRLYQNGTRVAELPNGGTAPVFTFSQGLGTDGDYLFYLEAIGSAFDSSGLPIEVASGPSNTVKVTVVTGSLSAPKNHKLVKMAP